MKKDEKFEKIISGDFSSVELKIAFANTTVTVSGRDSAEIRYTAGGNGREITAEAENGTLKIIEKGRAFSFGVSPSTLEIELPEKEYEVFSVKSGAGTVDISELICRDLRSSVASGQTNYRVFADNIALKTASGKCGLVNCTDRKAVRLTLDSASGIHNVSGFAAESFEIVSASGNISVSGISGRGEVHSASGNITLDYADWDDDLNIDIKSGKVEVVLPADSGIELDMDALAGSVTSSLNGEESKFTRECKCSFGGSNSHRVKAILMSGSVSFKN